GAEREVGDAQEQHADREGGGAVGVLEERVLLGLRDEAAVAGRPVGAAEAGVGGAYGAADDNEDEGGGDRDQQEALEPGHRTRHRRYDGRSSSCRAGGARAEGGRLCSISRIARTGGAIKEWRRATSSLGSVLSPRLRHRRRPPETPTIRRSSRPSSARRECCGS